MIMGGRFMLLAFAIFNATAVVSLHPELDVGGATPQQLRQLLRRLPEGTERDYVDAALVELLEARRGAPRGIVSNSVPTPQAVAARLGPPPEEALEFAADHHYTQNLPLSRAQLAKRVHDLVAALEAERLAPAFDVAYCVVGQERGFSSPVVYESLRRNVMRALNESLADWHAQHPPPEPSLLHHRRRRLSSDKSEARRAKRRKDRATAWATLTGGRGSSKVTETTVHKSEERSEPYSSSALDGSSETRHSIDSGSRSSSSLSASSARSHARSDGPSSSATASTTTSSSRSSASTGGGVRGDVFVYVKIDGTEVTEARRAARRIGAGADSIGIVRKAALRDAHWLASQQGQNPSCPFTQHGDALKRKFAVVSFDQKRCFELVRDAEERRGGKRYTHVMKLRTDQQVCTPLSAATLAPAFLSTRQSGESRPAKPAIVKQRDHWAFVPRQWADVYFNASYEVLGKCHSRNVYDSFPTPPGSQLEPEVSNAPTTLHDETAVLSRTNSEMSSATSAASTATATSRSPTRRCHWHSRNHPDDVPNECLLDHWLASNGVPFVEVMVPTCIRKKKSAVAGEPCPAISFNRSRKADTRNC